MRRTKRRFSIERLEDRFALAGNVLATVDGGGNLLITGDALSNGVTIQGLGNPGQFGIFGFDVADAAAPGADATSINGTPNAAVFLTGVTGTITVNLGAGNDTLLFWHFNHNGAMSVTAGTGNDSVYVGLANDPMFIVGNFNVDMGEGVDTLNEQFINIVGSHSVSGNSVLPGNAADGNNWHSYTLTDSTFSGNVRMEMGYRAGGVTINNIVTAQRLTIENISYDSTVNSVGKSRTASFYGVYDLRNASASQGIRLSSDVMTDADLIACQSGGNLQVQLYGYYNRANIQDSYVGNDFEGTTKFTTVGAPGLSQTSYAPIDDFTVLNTYVVGNAAFDLSTQARFQQSTANDVYMTAQFQVVNASVINNNLVMNTENRANRPIGLGVDYSTIAGYLSVTGRYVQKLVGQSYQTTYGVNDVEFGLLGSTVGTLSYGQLNSAVSASWSGHDQAHIQYSVMDTMLVQFGTNNDQLTIIGSRVDSTTTLNGGAGTNTLYLSGNQPLNGFSKANFQ